MASVKKNNKFNEENQAFVIAVKHLLDIEGYTQRDIAKYAGVSQQQISNIIGKRQIGNFNIRYSIADFFSLGYVDLVQIGREIKKSNPGIVKEIKGKYRVVVNENKKEEDKADTVVDISHIVHVLPSFKYYIDHTHIVLKEEGPLGVIESLLRYLNIQKEKLLEAAEAETETTGNDKSGDSKACISSVVQAQPSPHQQTESDENRQVSIKKKKLA